MGDPAEDLLHVSYAVERSLARWELEDRIMPEARPHELRAERIRQLLDGWRVRCGVHAQVGRNLAVRWDVRNPKVGVDPDVYVVTPPPPEADEVRSLKLWLPGHVAPALVVEVVSAYSHKDYVEAPERYGACGVQELWVYDPDLEGPRIQGGPYLLQAWQRDGNTFRRVAAGVGPYRSGVLGAWVRVEFETREFQVSDDEAGQARWRTPEEDAREAEHKAREAEHKAREAEQVARSELEQERAEKERLLAKLRELEAAGRK